VPRLSCLSPWAMPNEGGVIRPYPSTTLPALGRNRPVGARQLDFPSVLPVLIVAGSSQ
jgi:hypothetical protein